MPSQPRATCRDLEDIDLNARFLTAAPGLVLSSTAFADSPVEPLTQQLGPLMWWLGALIGLLALFALMAGLRRKNHGTPQDTISPQSPNDIQTKRNRHGLIWGAFVLLVALGMPVADILLDSPKPPDTLLIRCTASQWKWHFSYQSYQQRPVQGLAFFSAMRTPASGDTRQLASLLFNAEAPSSKADKLLEVDQPLVLPVGAKVRFDITSEDTIHAWWIPAFNVKKEAIPGFLQSVEVILPAMPGTYRGMCSQLCGQEHAFMPIVVQLVPVAEFEAWLALQPAHLATRNQRSLPETLPRETLLARGQTVYRERCELCHGADGSGHTSRMPVLANNAAVSGRADALLQLLQQGRNVMPGMRDVLARDELAALASYLRLRWSALPATEATVQPIDVPASF